MHNILSEQLTTIEATPEWIAGFCREFSVATGWPIIYTAVDDRDEQRMRSDFLSNPECCWSTDIRDHESVIGFLHIDLPTDPGLDHSFLAVCDLAQLFSQLIGRSLSAMQSVESISQNMTTWVDVDLTPTDDDFVVSLKKLLKAVTQLTGFRSAAFFLLDTDANQLMLRGCHPPELLSGTEEESSSDHLEMPQSQRLLTESPFDRAALSGNSVLVSSSDTPEHAVWLPEDSSIGCCKAVRSNMGTLGTLWAFDRRHRIPSERENHVLQSLATRIAAVLERAVLLHEQKIQRRQKHDLHTASESQIRDILSGLPDDLGFDVSAVCTSRYELGGDLCELIPLDKTRTVIAVGDASGDSVPAAMVMSAVRGAVRALSSTKNGETIATETVMQQINHALHDITPSHQFMSLLYGIFDSDTNCFQYTNAGHPAPLLLRGSEVIELESHGLLLGILDESEYTQTCLQLQTGDILIAFSDGISEAMNSRKVMFRQDGIAAVAMPLKDHTAAEILQEIWGGLESHIAETDGGDDRTLLVLRI